MLPFCAVWILLICIVFGVVIAVFMVISYPIRVIVCVVAVCANFLGLVVCCILPIVGGVGVSANVVLLVGVVGVGKDGMLGEHHGGLVDLERGSVLGVIGVGSFVLVFFIVLSFPTFPILVSRLPTVAAWFGIAIAKRRFV